MGTRAFWLGLVDRSAKSAAQSLLLLWAGDGAFNVIEADFPLALGVAAGAAALSALTSIASGKLGEDGTTAALPGAR